MQGLPTYRSLRDRFFKKRVQELTPEQKEARRIKMVQAKELLDHPAFKEQVIPYLEARRAEALSALPYQPGKTTNEMQNAYYSGYIRCMDDLLGELRRTANEKID